MTYRKTWFDYVLWAVYAGVCVILLAYVGNHIYVSYVGESLARLGTFLPFPVLICLYLAIRQSSLAVRKKYHVSPHASAMAESLVVAVSFVFGLIFRLREGILGAAVSQPGEYYEMAVVRAGTEGQNLVHGLSNLFVGCLRMVFSFLGNSMMAAALFQTVLQMLILLYAYLVVRKAAGRFAACTVLLLLAFSDAFISRIYVIDPECMMLAVLLAGLCMVLSFMKEELSGRSGFGGLARAVFLGTVLGFLCYLECGMAVLFLFLAGLFTGKMGAKGSRKRLAGRFFLVLAGSVAGFLGAVGIDASFGGVGFKQGLVFWAEPYLSMETGGRTFDVTGTSYPFFLVLFLLASFLGFAFIRGGREQDFTLWLLPGILVAPVFFWDYSVVGFGAVALFFWGVLAALGLKNAVFCGQAEILREKIEEINASAAPIPVAAAPILAASSEPKGKPRFIENPLPLPKRHVKREMDYDYEVAEADMYYQMEVAEGDDFDF